MFLKRTHSKNHTYLSLAETYRENGKIKHRTLLRLGREDELKKNGELLGLLQSICKQIEIPGFSCLSEQAQENSRHNWGAVKVYRKLWDEFEIDEILTNSSLSKHHQYDYAKTVFLTVLSRLLDPCSKLKTYERRHDYLGFDHVELHHLYRAMDQLAEGKDKIEKMIFDKNTDLFNMQVDVVFYDVTTLYFESVDQDELRNFGYSKDCKFGEVQVVLGLLIDMEGRPIGFDVYPGNTFEGKTLKEALLKLKHRFSIRRVIIVADRGLNSKINLDTIKQEGFDYIVGSRLKSMSNIQQSKVLDRSHYLTLPKTHDKEDNRIEYQVIEYSNKVKREDGTSIVLKENLICTWSKKRSVKDKKDRDRLVQKATEMIKKPCVLKSKRGAKKYINSPDNGKCFLDQDKIAEDEKWDGFYGIQTSRKELSINEVLDAYHKLWKIEESFRIMKSSLQIRPIFHWTPTRIKGHLVMCFLAFLLERTLEIKLKTNKVEASVEGIRSALSSLQVSIISVKDNVLYMRSKIDGLALDILRTLKISLPKTVSDQPPI